MNKEQHKQRFSLTLLVSFCVFIIITAAVGLAEVILYVFMKTDLLHAIEGMLKISDILIFILPISVIIGFVITMLTSRITLAPFNRMVTQLNRLASGDFKARIKFGKPLCNNPTFKEMENSFNRAAEEFENTEMFRNDFINNFSHEFKTPIVSIAGFANLLRYGNLSPEETNEYLQIIEEESMRLSYMATNILNLTKVENQTILTDTSKFNLSEQIRSAALLLADKWSQKNLKFDMNFDEEFIVANEELLKQVWINLIDNAVKFSAKDGTVSIKITDYKDNISVDVINQGKDIPKESISRIFNKFYQADESHSSDGNGIGLAVVKKIVDLHNGNVTVDSQNGTTRFTVTLPKNQ